MTDGSSRDKGALRPFPLDALREECHQITRYLVGQAPPEDLVCRYIEAHTILLNQESAPCDIAIVTFIRQYPWSLPYLDAVLAIRRPTSFLRHKILLMVALLEATPKFTDFFFPEPLSCLQFLGRMIQYSLSSGIKVLIGCMIYPIAVHSK